MTLSSSELPLPDGRCRFTDQFLSIVDANRIFETLKHDVKWRQPEITMFGRKVLSPRLAAWYGDAEAVYRYSGLENRPLPWLPVLHELRQSLEHQQNQSFNSVLLNLYRDGNDAMGWHADDEPELGLQPVIASISLGAARRFLLRHRSDRSLETLRLELGHGSLLVMDGTTQQHWKHAVPRIKKNVGARINLTFRQISPAYRPDREAGVAG